MAGAIFLMLDGIKGEATDEAHKEEINVLSYSWGMNNPTAVHSGAGTAAGKVSVQDLVIVKNMDKASPTLTEHCCLGKVVPAGTLTVQRAGEDKVQALVLELTHVFVTAIDSNDSADSGQLPSETIVLSFKEFKFKYTPQDKKGKGEAEIEVGFNIAENIKV
ncbi:MAG: type VI secretion system tube protein Hcp [Gammaproteobacteria bacterium]|nr:MAG: type VI secretion system tube protein Hcp [Gammaproteobacteria bacterium]